jgi:hypothetical protein
MDRLEDELVEVIGDEYEAYMSHCDGRMDAEEFMRAAKENIEGEYGDKFDDYSVESYCISYCERRQDIYGGDYE